MAEKKETPQPQQPRRDSNEPKPFSKKDSDIRNDPTVSETHQPPKVPMPKPKEE